MESDQSDSQADNDFQDQQQDQFFGDNAREELLAELQPELHGGQQNEFLRNPQTEIQEIVSRARNRRSAEEKQMAKKKQEIKKNLTTYYESIRCYFLRNILTNVRRVSSLSEPYIRSQILSRLEFPDIQKLFQLKHKQNTPFSVICRFLLTLLRKYRIRDLNSVDVLFRFMGIHTRRIYLVDLRPFELKKIQLNYWRKKKRKGEKEGDLPDRESKRENRGRSRVLEKIEEEVKDADAELDDKPENYIRRKTTKVKSRLPTQESSTTSCPDKFQPTNELSLCQHSQTALQSRLTLESLGQKYQWLDLYDPDQHKWRIISPRNHVILTQQMLKRQLNGVPTILLYSVKNLQVKKECQWLFTNRNIRRIEVKDLTYRFADNIYYIKERRHRIGVAGYLGEVMRLMEFRGSQGLLEKVQAEVKRADYRSFQEVNMRFFPKNPKEMRMSELFITPSLISKFHVLKQGAQPVPNILFKDENVFRKHDLIHLHSKYGWVDVGRMVKQDAQAIRVTLTKDQSKDLKLYSFQQTQPFKIVIQNGKFLKNQYGSIYINKKAEFPPGTILVQQNVRYVCKKNGIEHSEVIRGFTRGRPNPIGFLIFERDRQRVLELYEERVRYLEEKRKQAQQNQLRGMWKKLFKAILISESLEQRYRQ